jgi:N-acetylmuramoyl-L-alanine amidase-like protein
MPKRILVQAGHNAPREPGFEGGTGTTREIEFTHAMQTRLVAILKADDRFHPIPQPGDLTDTPCDAALYFHGDGSSSSSSRGRSFGFPIDPVNKKLAALLEKHLSKIPGAPPDHADNYTGGLREYYGYRRISTKGPEVLIEHGFLTNPTEQKWLFSHLAEQATAEYHALCEFFGIPPKGAVKPARVGFIVEWTDKAGVAHRRRTFAPRRLFLRLWSDGIRRRIVVRRARPIQPA